MTGVGNGEDFSLERSSSMHHSTRPLSSGSVEKLEIILHVVVYAHQKWAGELERNKKPQESRVGMTVYNKWGLI